MCHAHLPRPPFATPIRHGRRASERPPTLDGRGAPSRLARIGLLGRSRFTRAENSGPVTARGRRAPRASASVRSGTLLGVLEISGEDTRVMWKRIVLCGSLFGGAAWGLNAMSRFVVGGAVPVVSALGLCLVGGVMILMAPSSRARTNLHLVVESKEPPR